METKKLLILAVTFVICTLFSAPFFAQNIEKSDITQIAKNNIHHNKIVKIVKESNIIEEKCDNIYKDVLNRDKESLVKNLGNITIEEFYSKRHCMEIIPMLLDQTEDGKNMKDITKVFINKFGHPDNLIVSFTHPDSSFYRMTLLGYWGIYAYYGRGNNNTNEVAKLLLAEGADINEEMVLVPGEKNTIKHYVQQSGNKKAQNLIKNAAK